MATHSPANARNVQTRHLLASLIGGVVALACGTSSTGDGGGQTGIVGEPMVKPNVAPLERFLVDENRSGSVSRLQLIGVSWGRLVDIHDVDNSLPPQTDPIPLYRDFAIGQDFLGDGVDYRIETNPVTHRDRLVILRTFDPTGESTDRDTFLANNAEFFALLRAARDSVEPVTPKNDDGSSAGPFTFIARNACVVLRFNDFLRDDAQAMTDLVRNVRVLTGYRPAVPFEARVIFDPNFGGLRGGEFHSTRIIVDMTSTATESGTATLRKNAVGLPPSQQQSLAPNVSIRIPTQESLGAGQFTTLRSLSGVPLSLTQNGPADMNSPTRDIVRAMRSGNSTDANNGFLLDETRPEIVGAWDFISVSAAPDGTGDLGFDFVIEAQFTTVCQDLMEVGDILEIGPHFLEVTEKTSPPDGSGNIVGIKARNLSTDGIVGNAVLSLSNVVGSYLSTYDLASSVPIGCWVSFEPPATTIPTTGVSTTAAAAIRFSEPMDPAGLSGLDSLQIVNGDSSVAATAKNVVVGNIEAPADLDRFRFVPSLPLDHTQTMPDPYHLSFGRNPKDLAGNDLFAALPDIDFTIAPADDSVSNGGIVMLFNAVDEVGTVSTDPEEPAYDLRGQVFYDLAAGTIKPRGVEYESYVADRSQVLPGLMTAIAPGVQDPLAPLGSKVQALWRYCDFGWLSDDETKFNLDVIGLNWAPLGGAVTSTFFERFEIALGHAVALPDEYVNDGTTGLSATGFFEDNVIDDVATGLTTVHEGSFGYRISPVDLFKSQESDTFFLPYPFNRAGGPRKAYLWRDTAVTSTAPFTIGLPLPVEVVAGLEPANSPPISRPARTVVDLNTPLPSFGMPLLMEFRCYPSSTGIGVNRLDASFASTAGSTPNFRAYSTGGTDSSGATRAKNPDLQLTPTGGFNPVTGTPSAVAADNVFYMGQLDTVTRVSRVHTIWLDTETPNPIYVNPVVEPDPTNFPSGTQLLIDYRGATAFNSTAMMNGTPFDAVDIDPYGNFRDSASGATFLNGNREWTSSISQIDGAKFFQVRLTFINNVTSRLSLELSALGFAFEEN